MNEVGKRRCWRAGLMLACLCVAGTAFGQRTAEEVVDLSRVPQLNETAAQHNDRMQWFRDAKFGLFIHWGPCSVGPKRIGWGRGGTRPWDIRVESLGPRTEDPVYDNYYKQFNPVKYNAEEWVSIARGMGVKYIVFVTKCHDGFCMFDSALTDYDIMATPYGKDVLKDLAAVCHKQGMRFGLYYSTRDWYQPDYLVGDNVKYDEWYRSQISELMTNYGKIDVLWFDHVGGQDWSKWRMDKLFALMYEKNPALLINDRATKFVGRGAAAKPKMGPVIPALAKIGAGDYYTPEGRIGTIDLAKDWESCIPAGLGWSYAGETGTLSFSKCLRTLVSCVTGGGNLLLDFGPRPDGTFTDGDKALAVAMGEWLDRHGEAIYGTRGGPYRNGVWGGSCHRGNKLYLHVFQWPKGDLEFDPLPYKVSSARTLSGGKVVFKQTPDKFFVVVAEADQVLPVTVVELTLDRDIPAGTIVGNCRTVESMASKFGSVLSENAVVTASSAAPESPKDQSVLVRGDMPGKNMFCTAKEKNPWAMLDLGDIQSVKAVAIYNSEGREMDDAAGLILSVSDDGKNWKQVWQAKGEAELSWIAELKEFRDGIDYNFMRVRFIKLETRNEQALPLHLKRVIVFGE
jgi:alpha-L-fucosidase